MEKKFKIKAIANISAMGGVATPDIIFSQTFDSYEKAKLFAEKIKNSKCVPFLGNSLHYPDSLEILENN